MPGRERTNPLQETLKGRGKVKLANGVGQVELSKMGHLAVSIDNEVKQRLSVPVQGVVSDGQHSIRLAVAQTFPEVAHQLCHFHSLREAAKPIYEADRHAKKELKKQIRGVRPIERAVEGKPGAEAQAVRDYA
jgi:Transposase, Mutator family